MQVAISNLITPGNAATGIDQLCAINGISLVIASKIYRFCVPNIGAAVDRHTSYFFNSLSVRGQGTPTHFQREWANGAHTSSRLATYNPAGYASNRAQYFQEYLPLLAAISNSLNNATSQYRCAASGVYRNWFPTDVEMAAYYYWARYGVR